MLRFRFLGIWWLPWFLLSLAVRCWRLGQYQYPVLLHQWLVLVCSEICRNTLPISSCLLLCFLGEQPSPFIHNRCVGGSAVLDDILHLYLVIFYTCPCFPLLAASSWFSIYTRLSAFVILFTVWSVSWYCCLYISFSFSNLMSNLMACQVSFVIHSLLFFCLRPRQVSLVCE